MLFAMIEHVIAATRTRNRHLDQMLYKIVAEDEYAYICAPLDDHIKGGLLITYFVKVPEPKV